MIEEITQLFYELSREHKLIRSFKYDTLGRGQGIGNEYYPQFFLEEPIIINTNTIKDNTTQSTINFDILLLKQSLENFNIPQPTDIQLQSIAHKIGLNYVAKINQSYNDWLSDDNNPYQPFKVVSYNFMTLRYFYDNDATGVRGTIVLERLNPLDKCLINEHFDPNKQFNIDDLLPNIPTPDASGCVEFGYKLPEINY